MPMKKKLLGTNGLSPSFQTSFNTNNVWLWLEVP